MKFQSVLKNYINPTDYHLIDLSTQYLNRLGIDIQNHLDLKHYIKNELEKSEAKIAYGGYFEKRSLYNHKKLFQKKNKQRDIHLGIDFWAEAGEEVVCPYDAVIHSYANNRGFGNYGPCIILKHTKNQNVFYTLYGHLSQESLLYLKVGQPIKQNQVFCRLGHTEENGNYVSHLHFQIIKDIGDNFGDYPGVCQIDDVDHYKNNTVNPISILGL